jgi:hypothetical protein
MLARTRTRGQELSCLDFQTELLKSLATHARPAGFETERDLVTAIAECVNRSRGSYRMELELDAGVGIADLVLANREPRSTRAVRLLACVPPRLSALLDPEVAREIRSRSALAARLGLTEQAATRVLRHLRDAGLVKVTASEVVLSSIRKAPFAQIIAVEAKLSDWPRALVQAYRNRQFADESWVVLDHRFHQSAIAQIGRFQRSGVGLASVAKAGGLYIHCAALSAPAGSASKRWHAQAALARRAVARIDRGS